MSAAAGVLAGQSELDDEALAAKQGLARVAQALPKLAGDGLDPDLGASGQPPRAEDRVVLRELGLDEPRGQVRDRGRRRLAGDSGMADTARAPSPPAAVSSAITQEAPGLSPREPSIETRVASTPRTLMGSPDARSSRARRAARTSWGRGALIFSSKDRRGIQSYCNGGSLEKT
jgi:hypothetical protein